MEKKKLREVRRLRYLLLLYLNYMFKAMFIFCMFAARILNAHAKLCGGHETARSVKSGESEREIAPFRFFVSMKNQNEKTSPQL